MTVTNLRANVSCKNSGEISLVLLVYGTEELETRDNLLLRIVGLDNSADNGHIYVLCADIVR